MLDLTTARTLIKAHMPVVCSNEGQFANVDHLEGTDVIKLTRDKSGQHHYIPIRWVTTVDDKVHIDRPRKQAMREWSTTPPLDEQKPVLTRTEEMRGQPLAARVETRVAELEQALSELDPADARARTDIEMALSAAQSLTTGDTSHPSDVVGAQLNDWLERNKNLGLTALTPPRGPEPAPDSTSKESAPPQPTEPAAGPRI